MQEELIVIAAPDDFIAGAGSISRGELNHMPFVSPARDSASRESILDQVRAAGIRLHPVLAFGSAGLVNIPG